MPISKVQLPSSNTPVDIRNGHSANVTYVNGTFSATVSTVRTPYAGLILTLYFPTQLDIEAGVKTVTLTFADGNNYTAQFMILGYSYEYVVPVLIQIKSITSGVLDYDIIHKGSVPSGSDCMSMELDSVDDTQLNFLENSNAQSTVVITYPDEDIEGTSYEVYASSEIPKPSVADYGKVIGVDESGKYNLENVPQEVPKPASVDVGKMIIASESGYELVPQNDIATVKNFLIIARSIGAPETASSQSLTIQSAPNIDDIFDYLKLTTDGGARIKGAIQLTLACGALHPLFITDWISSTKTLTAMTLRYVGDNTVNGVHYYHFICFTVHYNNGWTGYFTNILYNADDYNTIMNPDT